MAGIARALVLAAVLSTAVVSASTVERFHGARIVVPENSDVAKNGRGQWLITVKGGCNDSDVQALAVNMPQGTKPVYSGHPDKGGLCLFVMTGTRAQVKEELASHDLPMEKVIAEADEALDEPEDEGEEEEEEVPWGLDRIDQRDPDLDGEYQVPQGKRGEGVHVFVFDSGIFLEHEEFQGRALPYLDVTKSRGRKVERCTPDAHFEGDAHDADDDCSVDWRGHGTHCAGTIAGKTVGVAPAAILHSVKVLTDDTGSGQWSWIIEALDTVLSENKPQGKLVSMSIQGGKSESMNEGVNYAVNRGLAVVVCAGNYADKGIGRGEACNVSPAGAVGAITVASSDDEDYRSSFSSYGKCVDIFAPGSDILSAGGKEDANEDTYVLMSGTSMACPHVTGAAALLLGENKRLSPYEVLQLLLDTSSKGVIEDPKGAPNKLLYVGDFGEEDE